MEPINQEAAVPNALEYLIALGVKGSHLLFENDRIREAFARQKEILSGLENRKLGEVQRAIRELLNIPDFEGKKEFIAALPKETEDILIFLYFQMIERNLVLTHPARH